MIRFIVSKILIVCPTMENVLVILKIVLWRKLASMQFLLATAILNAIGQ